MVRLFLSCPTAVFVDFTFPRAQAATSKEGIFVILLLALYFITFFYFVDKIIQTNFFRGTR